MANNCWNYVTFNGNAAALKKLRNKFKEYDKTNYFVEFGDFVLDKGKIGVTQEELAKKYKDFYHYGTRWWDFNLNDYPCDDEETFTVAGDSAWSPPVTLVEEICKHYSLTAEMEYEECGEDFAGIVKFDKHGITDHQEMTYHEYRYHDCVHSWMENLQYNFEDETDREELEHAMKEHDYAEERHIKEFIDMVLETNSVVNS